jgi:hypothetical protein
MLATRREAVQRSVTYLLQLNIEFCKYCARTNPTWRSNMAKAKKSSKKKAKKKAAKKK